MCSSGRGQVLIPWPNRLEDGSYEFDGRRHQHGRACVLGIFGG
jgi:aldose 1-epimerase